MEEPSERTDVIVLGAGIIGVCTALHLQARGRNVTLVDRREPGSETSHGNAGLIERSSVVPYAFPRDLATILTYAANRSIAVRYRPETLLRLLPWWRAIGGIRLRTGSPGSAKRCCRCWSAALRNMRRSPAQPGRPR